MATKLLRVKPTRLNKLNNGATFLMLVHGKFEPFVKVNEKEIVEVKDVNPLTVQVNKPWKEEVYIPV